MMDACNFDRCGRPPTVQVYDDLGTLSEVLCRPHAIALARGHAQRYTYRDAATGRLVLLVMVEVIAEP